MKKKRKRRRTCVVMLDLPKFVIDWLERIAQCAGTSVDTVVGVILAKYIVAEEDAHAVSRMQKRNRPKKRNRVRK